MEFLVRPKADKFSYEASLEELHRGSRFWLTELEFWKDELSFLTHLTDRYFEEFVRKEQLGQAAEFFKKLRTLREERLGGLVDKVNKHESHLAVLLENPFEPDDTAFRVEHQELETQVTEFMKDYKAVKKEAFTVIEEIRKDEKPRQLPG